MDYIWVETKNQRIKADQIAALDVGRDYLYESGSKYSIWVYLANCDHTIKIATFDSEDEAREYAEKVYRTILGYVS